MDTKNKIHVNADDLIFDKAGEKENAIINKSRTKKLFSGFKKIRIYRKKKPAY